MLIDSHCHLDFPELKSDLAAVLTRARNASVGLMVTISTRVARFNELKEIVEANDNVYCSIGTHPHNAAEEPDITVEELIEISHHNKVVAIGEAGLDYHYDHSPRERQKEIFRRFVALARELRKPLVIHTRSAAADTLAVLEEERARDVGGIIHCFSEDRAFAERALELGFDLSFSGIVTFKSAKAIQEVAAWAPSDRIMVETDSPYLAPIPFRGKPCEPAHVVYTARRIAELRGVGFEEVARATTENARRRLGLAA